MFARVQSQPRDSPIFGTQHTGQPCTFIRKAENLRSFEEGGDDVARSNLHFHPRFQKLVIENHYSSSFVVVLQTVQLE